MIKDKKNNEEKVKEREKILDLHEEEEGKNKQNSDRKGELGGGKKGNRVEVGREERLDLHLRRRKKRKSK